MLKNFNVSTTSCILYHHQSAFLGLVLLGLSSSKIGINIILKSRSFRVNEKAAMSTSGNI